MARPAYPFRRIILSFAALVALTNVAPVADAQAPRGPQNLRQAFSRFLGAPAGEASAEGEGSSQADPIDRSRPSSNGPLRVPPPIGMRSSGQPSPPRPQISSGEDDQVARGGFLHQLRAVVTGRPQGDLTDEEAAMANNPPRATGPYREPFAGTAAAQLPPAPTADLPIPAVDESLSAPIDGGQLPPTNRYAGQVAAQPSIPSATADHAVSSPDASRRPSIVTPREYRREAGLDPVGTEPPSVSSSSTSSDSAAEARKDRFVYQGREVLIEPAASDLDQQSSSRRKELDLEFTSPQTARRETRPTPPAARPLTDLARSTSASSRPAQPSNRPDAQTASQPVATTQTAGPQSSGRLPDPISLPPELSSPSASKLAAGTAEISVDRSSAVTPAAPQREVFSGSMRPASAPETTASSNAFRPTAPAIAARPNYQLPQAQPSASVASAPAATPSATTATESSAATLPSSSAMPSSPTSVRNEMRPTETASPATHRLDMVLPQVAFWIDGPEQILVDAVSEYAVHVRNDSTDYAVGLLINLIVPDGIDAEKISALQGELSQDDLGAQGHEVLWHVPAVAPGRTEVLNLRLIARRPQQYGLSVEWTALPLTGEAKVTATAPRLDVELEGPESAQVNSSATYRIKVRNPSTVDLADVSLSLQADGSEAQRSQIGLLAAGKEIVVEAEMTFGKPGSVQFAAIASSPTHATKGENQLKVDVQAVELELAVDVPPQSYQGSSAPYAFHVKNAGRGTARAVDCSVVLPAGYGAENLPAGAVIADGLLSWTVDEIPAGATATLSVNLVAGDAGQYELPLAATAGSQQFQQPATATVLAVSDLRLVVNDPAAPAAVDAQVTYELTIENTGHRVAENVVVIAQFSHGIEPVSFEGAEASLVPGQVLFRPIASIAPGQKKLLRITAVADEPGTHRFRAEVRADEGETLLVQEESTRYLRTAAATTGLIVR